jgi:ElaB/YqjD/DUF883 family membrane-anchored ribosome-binding protein
MNTYTTSTPKPLGSETPSIVDQAADSAQRAIRATQARTGAALDHLSDQVDNARNQAAPVIDRVTSQVNDAAVRGVNAVRDKAAALREQALRASDTTVGYVRDEPWKAMLIAAATGAALMALIGLMNRSRPY